MLLVSDATKLPDVYGRRADKSRHYITGSFGKAESLFNMQDHRQHAYFRKIAAGPCEFFWVFLCYLPAPAPYIGPPGENSRERES